MKKFIFMAFYGFISNAESLSPERIIFHTNMGDMVAALYPETAPKHVEQILKMVRAGVYTDAKIFRIEPGFVAQVENYDARNTPLSEEARSTVKKIPGEFTKVPHRKGILSMARFEEDNDSAEASFSFMLGDAPHLDGKYTVFGELVAGIEVLDAIEKVPTLNENSPIAEILIQSAEIIPAADLPNTQLRPLKPLSIPGMNGKLAFEIFAALMFSITVLWPIIKSLTNPV